MTFSIAKLRKEHASDWRALRIEGAWEFPLGFLISEAEAKKLSLERCAELLSAGSTRGIFDQGNLVGFCGFRREAFERTQHRAEIGPFYVTSKYHGSGAAQSLMQALVREAAALGVAQLELFVDTENAQAIRFYEKFGFEKIATHPDGVRIDGVSRDDHFYRLKLLDELAPK